jgi:ABC-type transporter MlaC component
MRLTPRFFLVLIVAWLATPAAAEDDINASIRAFVDKVNQESVSFFASGSEAEARERCRALLAWAFDVPAMGKEALGRTWSKATEAERKEFLEAFEEDIISAYLRHMRAPGTALTFIGHRPPYEGHQLAASRRSVPGKDDQVWIWWIRPDGGSWRIDDLVLNGHSAVNTEAHEYATVLENNNGDMNALIAFMRKRASQ